MVRGVYKRTEDMKTGKYDHYKIRGKRQSKEHIKKRMENTKKTKSTRFYIPHNKNKKFEESYGKNKARNIKRRISKTLKKKYSEGIITTCWRDKEMQRKCARNRHIKPNKPESILLSIIKKNNLPFNYVGDGKIWFENKRGLFNPDFLSKNPKHIIEVFGDYWHNRPGSKKKDRNRIKTYKKYGYKTLVIWERELSNEKLVLNKINKFLSNGI